MDSLEINNTERVVELDSINEPVSKGKLTFLLLIFLLIFVGLVFSLGYFVGRVQSNAQETVSKEKSTTKTEAGKTTFTNPREGFSLSYPEIWKSTEKTGGAPGILLETDGASVELWLRVEQPFSFSQEQKDAITATNKVKIKVNDKEIEMTEHTYNTGGFFTVVVLPATTDTTLATFWIRANDSDLYTAAKEIVQSFKFQ
jgi:hypothetical protein